MLNLSTAIKVHKILNTTCVESARGIETGELIGFLSKGILAESCTGDDWHGLEMYARDENTWVVCYSYYECRIHFTSHKRLEEALARLLIKVKGKRAKC